MKRLLSAAWALGACCALAADPAVSTSSTSAFDVALQPGGTHEACMHLDAGDKRRWYFKSNAPVDFNIHVHEGEKASYSVKRERMRGDGGTFAAKSAGDYCWMWTAKTAAKVEGRIEP
jgi:hypothetical protein